MPKEIPPHIRRFIARHVDSVSTLDVLLLLRATPEKSWSAAEVARALVTGEWAAGGQLRRLHDHGILAADGEAFRYAPRQRDEDAIDELAECYARRRNAIIGIIFEADEGQAAALADAFRFRRRKD